LLERIEGEAGELGLDEVRAVLKKAGDTDVRNRLRAAR